MSNIQKKVLKGSRATIIQLILFILLTVLFQVVWIKVLLSIVVIYLVYDTICHLLDYRLQTVVSFEGKLVYIQALKGSLDRITGYRLTIENKDGSRQKFYVKQLSAQFVENKWIIVKYTKYARIVISLQQL